MAIKNRTDSDTTLLLCWAVLAVSCAVSVTGIIYARELVRMAAVLADGGNTETSHNPSSTTDPQTNEAEVPSPTENPTPNITNGNTHIAAEARSTAWAKNKKDAAYYYEQLLNSARTNKFTLRLLAEGHTYQYAAAKSRVSESTARRYAKILNDAGVRADVVLRGTRKLNQP